MKSKNRHWYTLILEDGEHITVSVDDGGLDPLLDYLGDNEGFEHNDWACAIVLKEVKKPIGWVELLKGVK